MEIQADVILFHPYDIWGYCKMGKEFNERYVRYMIARISAYRNVWWSLANEFDLMAPGAMAGHRGDKAMAAQLLGISIRTLRNKLRQYGQEGFAVPQPGEGDRQIA